MVECSHECHTVSDRITCDGAFAATELAELNEEDRFAARLSRANAITRRRFNAMLNCLVSVIPIWGLTSAYLIFYYAAYKLGVGCAMSVTHVAAIHVDPKTSDFVGALFAIAMAYAMDLMTVEMALPHAAWHEAGALGYTVRMWCVCTCASIVGAVTYRMCYPSLPFEGDLSTLIAVGVYIRLGSIHVMGVTDDLMWCTARFRPRCSTRWGLIVEQCIDAAVCVGLSVAGYAAMYEVYTGLLVYFG